MVIKGGETELALCALGDRLLGRHGILTFVHILMQKVQIFGLQSLGWLVILYRDRQKKYANFAEQVSKSRNKLLATTYRLFSRPLYE